MNKKVSINDVANLANVSKTTVSQVFNGKGAISKNTKERVFNAANELNYWPNKNARNLSYKDIKKIAIVINISENDNYIDEINAIYSSHSHIYASKLGYETIIVYHDLFYKLTLKEIIGFLNSENIQGLVVFNPESKNTVLTELLQSKDFYSVVVDADIVNSKTSCVIVDEYKMQYDIFNEMVKKTNAEKICYVKGKLDSYVGEYRHKAIQNYARNNQKVKIDFLDGDFSYDKVLKFGNCNLNQYDYIACANDMMAIAIYKLVDGSIPISGFDGIRLLDIVASNISTVKQDFKLKTQKAIEEIDLLINHDNYGRIVFIPAEIKT